MEFLCQELNKLINRSLSINDVINICDSYYQRPIYNMKDLKLRNKKIKGDIFEAFCYLYLLNIYNLKNVWYIYDLPISVQQKLNLTNKDMGIDFIGQDKEGYFYAIQAKFKKRNSNQKVIVSWRQLSTFYALCLKSGPYKKHIIITTANYVRHIGLKTDKDETIGYDKLSKIDHFDWIKICNYNNSLNKLSNENNYNFSDQINNNHKPDIVNNNPSLTKLREIRLSYYHKS